MIHSIGGVQVLFPWLEHAGKFAIKSDTRISIAPNSALDTGAYEQLTGDWVVVRSNAYTGMLFTGYAKSVRLVRHV